MKYKPRSSPSSPSSPSTSFPSSHPIRPSPTPSSSSPSSQNIQICNKIIVYLVATPIRCSSSQNTNLLFSVLISMKISNDNSFVHLEECILCRTKITILKDNELNFSSQKIIYPSPTPSYPFLLFLPKISRSATIFKYFQVSNDIALQTYLTDPNHRLTIQLCLHINIKMSNQMGKLHTTPGRKSMNF